MIDKLGQLLPGFRGRDSQVRCLAHVMNIIVKVSLPVF